MERVDIDRLDTSIVYLKRITEGRNPVNNSPADEDSVITNPNVVKCMGFIKDVLEELKRNDGYIGRKPRTNKDNTKKEYPLEALSSFQYTGDKSITKFVGQLNEYVDLTIYKKLTYNDIAKWLNSNGYLAKESLIEGKNRVAVVTEKGNGLGINSFISKDSRGKEFNYITLGKVAQEFIVKNMNEILNG